MQLQILQMTKKIDTTLDSKFAYPYKQSKFVPPNDYCLLIMGQSVLSINEYLENFPNEPLPSGWSAYWGITEFKGVKEYFLNEVSSDNDHQMLVDRFPNAVIQSALWMVGAEGICENVPKGKYDDVLKKFADWAKSVTVPIYLRIGYEFDGAHNELEPKDYVKAYKHIVDFLRKEQVNNIAYVWHSYASKPYKNYQITDWYPGDEYVDWMAISVFGHAYYNTDFGEYCDAVLDLAIDYKKPVMIAECNPIGGIDSKDDSVWNDWFVNFFSFVYNKNIKAISFINEDWQRLTIDGLSEWKDARLYNNNKVAKKWFKEVNKPKYLKESKDLFDQLDFPIKK